MDSLTQIVLGAAIGEAVLGKKVGNKALLWGAIAGTIPDLDVITSFFVNDVNAAELHRGFSHSILFSLIFAPIFGWLLSKLYAKKNEADFKGWSWLMFWAFITHPLLDCHTTWGTQLFWPLEYRVAYNNIFVADPIYTVPFLICVVLVLFFKRTNPKRRWINNFGLIWSSSYMLLTLCFKWFAFEKFEDNLEKKEITYSKMMTKPTPLNSLLWMANVKTDSVPLVGYYSLLDKNDNINFFALNNNQNLLNVVKGEKDFQRLVFLSKGYYSLTLENDTIMFSDLRFGTMGFDEKAQANFRYKMYYERDTFKVKRLQPQVDSLGGVFSKLIQRVKGEK